MKKIRQAIEALTAQLKANSLAVSTIGVTNMVVTSITATTGQALNIAAATGKDVVLKLTDAAGARKFSIIDSADAEVFKIDSDGNATGNSFIGDLTGDVTGDVTGDLTGNADTATVAEGINQVKIHF